MANPREIFPEEVWNLILNCVDDPQDIQSCSQTCVMFRRRLSPTRTTWAFPLVLPSLLQFLPRSDILQCRLVSKDWLKGVDSFLQSEKFAPTLVNQLRNPTKNLSRNFLIRIQNRQPQAAFAELGQDLVMGAPQNENWIQGRGRRQRHANLNTDIVQADNIQDRHHSKILNFLSAFEDNFEQNPFLSRAVLIRIPDTIFYGTNAFFNQFGDHICSLKLIVKMSARCDVSELQPIWNILKCVPNLKHLLIKELSENFNPFVEYNNDFLNRFLATHPAPPLKQLKWVELDTELSSIQDILVKAYSSRSVTIFEKEGYIKPCHLSNDWKHLTLLFNRQFPTNDWKGQIRSFDLLNLPLESINLQYSKCVDFELIFKCVSKYASTLRRFTLTFTNLQIQELIEMKNQVDAIYTYFLSQMKCLENFNMTFDCTDSDRKIEFRQFVDAILDADWIEDYLEMGGTISGFRRFGFACISAGMRMQAKSARILKRKYFEDGKYFRSMEMTSKENEKEKL